MQYVIPAVVVVVVALSTGCVAPVVRVDPGDELPCEHALYDHLTRLEDTAVPMHWVPSDFPLTLWVSEAESQRNKLLVVEAAGHIEAEVGLDLFRVVEAAEGHPGLDIDTRERDGCGVEWSEDFREGLLGQTLLWGRTTRHVGLILSCGVSVRSGQTTREDYAVLVHELGHVLGLADDYDDPGDTMYWLQNDAWYAEDFRFSEKAVDWIHAQVGGYCLD